MAKILSSLLIIMILVLQYNIWYSDAGKQKIESLRLTISQQQKQNELLSHQIEKLKTEVHLLRNRPEVLEEKAREQLGLIKKGEIFYRVIPAEKNR